MRGPLKLITKSHESLDEHKNSKFYTYLFRVSSKEEFEDFLARYKNLHSTANHFTYAFRILAAGQTIEASSDDGEPSGTAGRPILNCLQGRELINIGCIVVRFFGGTKLGTGGLVRAYSFGVKKLIASAALKNYVVMKPLFIALAYKDLEKLEYELTKLECSIESKEFSDSVNLKIKYPEHNQEKLKTLLTEYRIEGL